MATPTYALTTTYLHLGPDERAPAVPAGDAFWRQLMTGEFTDPRVAKIADGGWLVSRFTHTGDWPQGMRGPVHGDREGWLPIGLQDHTGRGAGELELLVDHDVLDVHPGLDGDRVSALKRRSLR